MTVTATQVANMALSMLGIDNLSDIAVDDTTDQWDQCNVWYSRVRDAEFRARSWNCLKTRHQVVNSDKTLTLSAITVGTSRTATAASAHFYSSDVGRMIYEVGSSATGVAEITLYTSSTVVQVEITTAFSTGLAADPLAAGEWRVSPLMDYVYEWVLPSDFMRLKGIDVQGEAWAIERGRLLTNYTPTQILYFRQDTDPTNWDPLLLEAIACRLAAKIAWPLTKKENAVRFAQGEYIRVVKSAVAMGVVESTEPAAITRTTLKDPR